MQKPFVRFAPVLALLALFHTGAAGQVGRPADPPLGDRIARAVEVLRTYRDTAEVPGLSAAIAVNGRLVWTGGFGLADIQNRVEAGPAMVSRIGSISKPIAAVAAMTVVEEGRLDLDRPVSVYLPTYPKPMGDRFTTRHLMTHTAGVRHYLGDEFLSNIEYGDVMTPLEVFWRDSLLFEPGTDYEYTTYGWTVVSAVTEGAAGRPWLEVLYDEVIRPLGLRSLQPEWQDSIIPHHASFYSRGQDGVLVNAPEVDLSNKWAGGGLVANTSDLVNFVLGLMAGELIGPASLAEMWRRQTPEGEASYGLGWSVGELDGRRAVSHSGGSVGATAMLLVLPDDGVVVSVLGNVDDVGHAGIAAEVARLFLD